MAKNMFKPGVVANMDSEDRVRVLGIIDQFRALGVNEDVSLPQLVVVGDQSSGKSSVLEGLTGLSFPIASELCTRFATQIVLRRSSDQHEEVRVSIIPGPTASNDKDQKAHLEGFTYALPAKDLDGARFKKLLDEAAEHMGLPTSAATSLDDLNKRFSDDVLKIEISGPSHHHLSVVDVPGLFHNPTKYQTEQDLNIIRNLIESYVIDPRTIILAVMDARNNLANQEVFRMARAADPEGKRTVGIITKCDALQKGDEDMVLKIAQNLVETLNHGWFVVKNRSTEDIQNNVSMKQRHSNEQEFFSRSPWTALSKERIGIHHLKRSLGRLLYDHIRSEFPTLVDEIRHLVTVERTTLDELGPARQTTQQQRQYLSRLTARYQATVADCLRGNYDPSWKSNDHRKLRMRLHLANEEFAEKLSRDGHRLPFQTINNDVDEDYGRYRCEDSIYDWIRRYYRDSRGSELPGTVNPLVLETLFRQQAAKWADISEQHLNTVHEIVVEFNAACFHEVFVDDVVRHGMANYNASFVHTTKEQASKQLQNILHDEMGGILQTVNHYFAQNLDAARQDRVMARLEGLGMSEEEEVPMSLSSIRKATCISNEDQAVFDIHDILKAYYQVALKRFADSVVTQVIERHYVGPDGPLKQTVPEQIGAFTDEQLSTIAGESYATSTRRNELSKKLERLEKALSLAENVRL